jgi:Flp pilus assembly CpaE family ATPase
MQWLVELFEADPGDADVVVRTPDVAGSGIELDLVRPEVTLATIRSHLEESRRGRVIEVIGAGGGTGCTSVALHLAAFLSASRPALFLETDPGCGGRLRLGLDTVGPSWADVERQGTLVSKTVPIDGGLRALFAPSEAEVMPSQIAEWSRGHFPYVIVDRGRGTSPLRDTTSVVLVMAPSVPSARRAAALLEEQPSESWAIVANRVGPGSEATDAVLQAILGGHRLALALPCSPSLRDAEDSGRLLAATSTGWSRRVARLARTLGAA